MIIEKINIKSFGALRDFSLEFSEGVNVIEGPNESGKSTIAAFIEYMLFGFPPEDDEKAQIEREKCISWSTDTAEGTMSVRVHGKRFLLTRITERSTVSGRPSYKEDSSIIDLETGTPAFGKSAAGEVFFGIDREMFENTAFFAQIGDNAYTKRTVKEAIENILFSASEETNANRACKKLTEKMGSLLKEDGTGGVIISLLNQAEELEEERRAIDENNRQILIKEAELSEIKNRRAEAVEREKQLTDLDNSYRNMQIIASFDHLHDEERTAEEKAGAYDDYISSNAHVGFAPDAQYLTDLTAARRRVNECFRKQSECEAELQRQKSAVGITHNVEQDIALADELGGESEILARASAHRIAMIRDVALAFAGTLLALAAIVFEILAQGAFAEALPRIIGGFIGGCGLVLVGIFLYFFFVRDRSRLTALEKKFNTDSVDDLAKKINLIIEGRRTRDAITSGTSEAKSALDRARAVYLEARQDLIDLVTKWSNESPEEEDFTEWLDRHEDKVRAFLEKKADLLSEKERLELTVRDIRSALSEQSEIDIRAQVSPLRRKALSDINHDNIVKGIAEAKQTIDAQDRFAFEIESELNLLKSHSSDPSEIYVRIRQLEDKVAEMKRRHKAYYVARQAISSARECLREEVSPRLASFSTDLMSVMTEQKYTSFDISDGLKVSFNADGEQKSVDILSGGTRDLTYIAVRMALIDMLYPDMPPVTFDESFAHQDNRRARSMMQGIMKLAKENGIQSFVFTCRNRESGLAKEMEPSSGIIKLAACE